MSFYYDILNAGFFYFVSIVTGLTIILTMVLFLMLNKFFSVKLFEFNIKKEIIKAIIIFLGGINIIVFIVIFISQARIPNQAYVYKLKKENIVIKPYDFLSISKQENFRFYKRKMNCFRLNLKLPNI
ncbi:hypothetical protein ACOZNX_001877 [Campylobacter jejuni]